MCNSMISPSPSAFIHRASIPSSRVLSGPRFVPVRAGLGQNRPVDTHPIHMLHVGVQGVAIREFRGVRPLHTSLGVQGITLLIRTEHADVPLYDHGGIQW